VGEGDEKLAARHFEIKWITTPNDILLIISFVLILVAWNDLLFSVLFFRNEWEFKLIGFSHFSYHFQSFSSILAMNGREKIPKNTTLMMCILLFAKKPFLWAQKSSRKLSFSLVSHFCHREWPYIWEEGWEEMTNISKQLTNGLHLFRPIIPGLVPYVIDKPSAWPALRAGAHATFE
jgi:hypothetical protein